MGQMINEMRGEINELRQMVSQLAIHGGERLKVKGETADNLAPFSSHLSPFTSHDEEFVTPEIIEEEALGLEDRERRAILRALEHNQGNRKQAAADLHISERTLYRKLKEYNINED